MIITVQEKSSVLSSEIQTSLFFCHHNCTSCINCISLKCHGISYPFRCSLPVVAKSRYLHCAVIAEINTSVSKNRDILKEILETSVWIFTTHDCFTIRYVKREFPIFVFPNVVSRLIVKC